MSENLKILSSIEGQYLGPTPSIFPENIGDFSIPSEIISWVREFVLVIKQLNCLGCMLVEDINDIVGLGLSPGCS